MHRQATTALIVAHSLGVFRMQKMDSLRIHFHELLNHFFEKSAQEAETKTKIQVDKQLVYLIFSIILDHHTDPKTSIEEQLLIDESKLYYFDLIFKHFDHFEEETKNLLLKIYFYRLIGGIKFRESISKLTYGPLTKEEFKSGLKHPNSSDDSPILDLIKYGIRNAGKAEHNCLLEFIKILKTKAKLTSDVSQLILKHAILNDDYEDIIKETYSTIFKIPTVQRIIKKMTSANESTQEV